MLQDVKPLYGRKLGATDGEIGQVKDIYFDDQTWAVRYLVADTGSWLSGRQVLLPPHAFGTQAFGRTKVDSFKILHVNLTRKQIEDSPSIDSHLPVSRQYEEEYYRHFGWPVYWQIDGLHGSAALPAAVLSSPSGNPPPAGRHQPDDIHLRSTKAVIGYHLQATDGPIGTVSSFRLDGKIWTVHELVVETGHWYAGKTVFVRPRNITRISCEDSTVFVNLTQDDIRQTARKEVVHAGAGHRHAVATP